MTCDAVASCIYTLRIERVALALSGRSKLIWSGHLVETVEFEKPGIYLDNNMPVLLLPFMAKSRIHSPQADEL